MIRYHAKQHGGGGAAGRGFSLTEVLMAIFVLGIGILSIASLFPAGIAQQRQSVDDITGPIVADNALSMIRTRVQKDDFGSPYWYQHNFDEPVTGQLGDWDWRAPVYAIDGDLNESGIEIFVERPNFDQGVPYNTNKWDQVPFRPIMQTERYYPQDSSTAPQYVWDCMFRRANGRIQVGIFVYQASIPGGGRAYYNVPNFNSTVPRETVALLDLDDNNNPSTFIRVPVEDVEGANPKWLVDENGHVHRILSAEQIDNDIMEFELTRPVPQASNFAPIDEMRVYFIPPASANGEFTYRPVYATVRDL